MGCFWSCQGSRERCVRCGRKAVNNLIIIDHLCEICISNAKRVEAIRFPTANQVTVRVDSSSRTAAVSAYAPTPSSGYCFGEFRCRCGRLWDSRRAWIGKWQKCDNCLNEVYASNTRPLRATDFARQNVEQHKRERCEMCKYLGYNCSKFIPKPKSKKIKSSTVWSKTHSAPRGRTYPARKLKQPATRATSWTKKNRKW